MDSRLALATEEPIKKDSLKKYKILCVAAAGKNALTHRTEDWRAAAVTRDAQDEETAAGTLKIPV
uniref:Ectonucleotide pyrophosphatase/phosphodiesterase 3 n=1 Tax=Mus musculus TaxID=10090 RepID=A0A1W2P751_MOUSE